MTNIDLKNDVQQLIFHLLQATKTCCSNTVSSNLVFFIRNVSEEEQNASLKDNEHKRYRDYVASNFVALDDVLLAIEKQQEKITWVDFMLYFSSENKTVIAVDLIEGSTSDKVSLHASIPSPPGIEKEKFDSNWYINRMIKI